MQLLPELLLKQCGLKLCLTHNIVAVPNRWSLGRHAVSGGDPLELPHHGHATLNDITTNKQQHLQHTNTIPWLEGNHP